MMKKRPLVILTGPTASGKTELSISLAEKINGEIISADSIQVYKYMDIGSAKVTSEEMRGIKHYLIDELYPDEEFNIFIFKEKAEKYIEEIYKKGKIPIIAGGTGFYIQALLYDIKFNEEENDFEYRKKLEELAEKNGGEFLHKMLQEIDPESASSIHFNNIKRVIRALEYKHITGEKISDHNEEQKRNESPYDFKYFVLNRNRDELYERINKRVDIMMENGLIDEVKSLIERGYGRELVSMQGIGYKEIAAYLNGEMDLESAISILKRDTRHFAKRQLTWFRREKEVNWIEIEKFKDNKEEILNYITDSLHNIIM